MPPATVFSYDPPVIFEGMVIYSHILSRNFRYSSLMEKYPYLNEAIASVLRKKREELGMSKRKLSELAMIERAYITGLEAGKWNATMNVIFYLSESLGLHPVDFVALICTEMAILKAKETKSPPLR